VPGKPGTPRSSPPHKSSLLGLFPFSPAENLDYFGHEDLEFTGVSTEPAQNPDPETGDMTGKGNVSFCCFLSKPVWIVASIHCDKDLAPDLRTKDVVRMQAETIGLTEGPTHLVQRMISSESGQAFFRNNVFSHGATMDEAQFREFMGNTVNGEVSAGILDKMGMVAVSAQVLIYKDADDYDSEVDEDSDDARQGSSPAAFDSDSLLYSVVIKTAPKPTEAASQVAEAAPQRDAGLPPKD
jgi:predicted metal-binding transcription factor (methanogenesis marker protein 9)